MEGSTLTFGLNPSLLPPPLDTCRHVSPPLSLPAGTSLPLSPCLPFFSRQVALLHEQVMALQLQLAEKVTQQAALREHAEALENLLNRYISD